MGSFGLSGDEHAPVKYAPYRPKRHSRNTSSSSNSNITPNWTSANNHTNGSKLIQENGPNPSSLPPLAPASPIPPVEDNPVEEPSSPPTTAPTTPAVVLISSPPPAAAASSSSAASSSRPSPTPITSTSTFRRVRPNVSSPLARPNSMLVSHRNGSRSTSSPLARPNSMLILDRSDSTTSSASASPSSSVAPPPALSPPIPVPIPLHTPAASVPNLNPISPLPLPRSPSRSGSAATPTPPSAATRLPTKAPYLPGFQPRGVSRNHTDDFSTFRKLARNGPESNSQKRVERTKLERRLEKIITLHFPEPPTVHSKEKEKSMTESPVRPSLLSAGDTRKRTSSFFEGLDIRRMSSSFLGNASEAEGIRSAEQRISPWQPDSAVFRCPHCDASFHPLSNRKHHCRLCGRVVCALGIRKPQRPEPCSILFVVDPKTGQIEQVEEGVDYGVRKRKTSVDMRSVSSNGTPPKPDEDEEEESQKFLRGVRVCRECKPVLLRQQYLRERISAVNGDGTVGKFVRLYEAFLSLEKEIEESLPQFEELLASLRSNANSGEVPATLNAAAATERKRLLKSFGAYDAITKKIRDLPCRDSRGNSLKLSGGHSQERVQAAISLRGARFLEARMVGLGVVPVQEHKRNGSKSKGGSGNEVNSKSTTSDEGAVDSQSNLHAALQPLLEQESLLESYVAEATATRKFEDAKTLRRNLREIQREIERLVNASGE